ncbi:PIN-like domain-containing protein [Rahnella aceris]|uniref:PIN-like domain-containing protein n=1 Tax=Rahnella sp. (strain Y9602) TaxID=2703885 RepID=UPI003B9F6D71
MRSEFKGFYNPKPEDVKGIWVNEQTIFIFDTNCLLNLYRCEEDTKNDFLKVLEIIKDKVWFPYQVCLEYQRNRLKVINDNSEHLQKIKSSLEGATSKIKENASQNKNRYPRLHEKLEELRNSFDQEIKEFLSKEVDTRIASKDYIKNHDEVRDAIDALSHGRIGTPFTQDEINSIEKDGVIRYENETPPGFKDNSKLGSYYHNGIKYQNKFGDLVMWKEVLRYAKSENVKNVILISDDNKDDWNYFIKENNVGPLESLQTEIYAECQIENFKIYSQSSFLYNANLNLDSIKVNDDSIEELDNLSLHRIPSFQTGTTTPEKEVNILFDLEELYEDFDSEKSDKQKKNQEIYNELISQRKYIIIEIDDAKKHLIKLREGLELCANNKEKNMVTYGTEKSLKKLYAHQKITIHRLYNNLHNINRKIEICEACTPSSQEELSEYFNINT